MEEAQIDIQRRELQGRLWSLLPYKDYWYVSREIRALRRKIQMLRPAVTIEGEIYRATQRQTS